MPHTLIIVMAHREAEPVCRRHLPYWKAHQHDLIFFCPNDSMLNLGFPCWGYGHASHHDTMANQRFLGLLGLLRNTIYKQFVIYEYDALSTKPDISRFCDVDLLYGNIFRDDRPHRGFIGTTFIHPPLIFGRKVLTRLLHKPPDPSCEQGFWDRMLGLMVERQKINTFNFLDHNLGFARNTIEPHDLSDAHKAAKAGCQFFHGVKSEAALKAITV
jgi:hypothetical protein